MTTKEVWRDVPSLPGVIVSSEGRVMVIPYRGRMPGGGKRRYGGTEDQLHRAVASYLSLALRGSECLWFHPANGEKRSITTAVKLKAMGVRPGTPDLCFVLPGGGSGFIELKSERGVLSPSQKAFRACCEALGARWALCRSVEDVAMTLDGWGVPLHAVLFNRQICVRVT